MPPISSHMHFGKIFVENSDDEIDIKSFLIGIVAPDTIYDKDDFEDIHCLDEDGNIDVREFYEQFDLKKLNLKEKSFILGYYSRLWFDEYYKFNASKLTIHNSLNLNDKELPLAVKNVIKYYDAKAIGSFYNKIKTEICDYDIKINLKEIEGININDAKSKIIEYFEEEIPKMVYNQLLEEKEYMNFINESCKKIYKSL